MKKKNNNKTYIIGPSAPVRLKLDQKPSGRVCGRGGSGGSGGEGNAIIFAILREGRCRENGLCAEDEAP